MAQRRNRFTIVLLIILSCVIMAVVEAVLAPGYGMKSLIKIVLFLLIPTVLLGRNKSFPLTDLFKVKGKHLSKSILLGVGVYALILGAYFSIGSFFDFSQVAEAITNSSGVSKEEFVWVALYISFINSLLEEYFFRGIGFLMLGKVSSRRFAYLFSALMFALYHIAIMSSWFSIYLFLLLMASLVAAGFIFDWLDEKNGTVHQSWLVHMFANFAINTIGFMLFGII